MSVTVVDIPFKLPAKCFNCSCPNNRDGRKFFDLHMDIPRYGRLYLCSLCFDESARKLGYIHDNDLSELREKLTLMEKELTDENRKLRGALANLDFLGSVDSGDSGVKARHESAKRELVDSLTSDGRYHDGEGTPTKPSDGDTQRGSIHPPEGERDSSQGELGPPEQSEIRRPDDVPATFTIDGPI